MSSHRVKVTLPEDSSLAIRRLSAASGESMSSIIAGLLEPNVSTLNELSDALENAEVRRLQSDRSARSVFRLAIDHICTEKAKFKESFSYAGHHKSARSLVKESSKLTVLKALAMGMIPVDIHPYDPNSSAGVWFTDPDGDEAKFAVYDGLESRVY